MGRERVYVAAGAAVTRVKSHDSAMIAKRRMIPYHVKLIEIRFVDGKTPSRHHGFASLRALRPMPSITRRIGHRPTAVHLDGDGCFRRVGDCSLRLSSLHSMAASRAALLGSPKF
jgi:hypothetical protein